MENFDKNEKGICDNLATLKVSSISGTTDDANHVPLPEINKKPALVLLYHTDCLGCTGRALPLAYQLSQEFPDIRLVVVHVQFAKRAVSREDILAVFTNNKPPFPIYLDENAAMYEKYEAEGTPHWLVFDEEGQLVHSIFGSMDGAQNRLYYALEEVAGT